MKNKTVILLATLFAGAVVFLGTSNFASAQSSYAECVGWCDAAGDEGDAGCYEACAQEFNASGGGAGTGTDFECPYGYREDPNNANDCIPTDGCPDGYALQNGECVSATGEQSQCDYGYDFDPSQPAGQECVPADSCPDGSAMVNGACTGADGQGPTCDKDGYTWSTYYEACVGGQGARCTEDSNCGGGLSCGATFICERNLWGALSGMGNDNVTSTTTPTLMDNGQSAPPGSFVTPDGQVFGANGERLGSLAPGVVPQGSNVPAPDDPSGGGGGNSTPQTCKQGFDMIGGVCFPNSTSTGLPDPQGGVRQIIINLFSWLLGIFTVVAIIAFLISGLQYLTSAGNEDQIETAKRNTTWSLVGILVGLSGFVIIQAIEGLLSARIGF